MNDEEIMTTTNTFQFADRVKGMQASSTLAVVQAADRLRAAGVEVIDLGAGEPDFPTPDHIKQAANLAIEQNFTKYTAADGTADLKKAIIERMAEDYGVEYAMNQVMATAGAKQALFNAIATLINPGDEVLIPGPCWVSFPEMVAFAEGKTVLIDTEPTGFDLSADLVKQHITPRSKLLILNSPCNPTGRAISAQTLHQIIGTAAEHGVLVISDETYREFVYPPAEACSAAQVPAELRPSVLVCGSMSKTYAMTGWRLGYALGSAAWIKEMVKVQSHSTSNPTSIAQKAAIAGLRGPRGPVIEMLSEYRRRREYLIPALNEVPGISCLSPEGAFYAFPNIKPILANSTFKTSAEVQLHLLEKYHIAVVSGSAFGIEGYLRISYANSLEALKDAVARLHEFARSVLGQ
jgi:aspartate aminotransferase